jgi:hypothetical protein
MYATTIQLASILWVRRDRIRFRPSPLPLDLGDLSDQVANFVAIEFSNFGESVEILNEVFWCAKKG